MISLDEKVIGQVRQWLQCGEPVWLCTVIHTWGSAPRLPGSLMVCNQQGVVVGSLSGGCVEDDLIAQLQAGELAQHAPVYKLYGQTKEEVERFRLPCGGTLGVLIEPLEPAQLDIFTAIESALQQRKMLWRQCDWPSNTMTTCAVSRQNTTVSLLNFECDDSGRPISLRQVYGPLTQLIIIGITEVSRFLAEFALAADYQVTVCDPRAELAEQWQVANTTVLTAMPDDVIREQADSHTAIVALSHDPRVDDMGLMDAFATEAFYIGAMGSQKSSNNRRQRLQQLGVSEQQLQRLHAPIGLDISSKTPVEIAVSILAQLIAARAQKTLLSDVS